MPTTADTQPVALCRLEDIPDPGSRGLTHAGEQLFAVRQGADVQVFVNRCPHRGIPLEWVPDQFLDSSGRLIQCATHGALFLPDTGECVSGPCAGERLARRESRVQDGQVWLV
ncbi:Rieske 2Fe-2S domain-containing protein [Halopseudomonas nanhaiensis]|uniref:Rieske (2Fe-2S) protein n=1 Tax=Halopseudomonas nanhaiensis TaxID=2830842 RepID=UPI001CBAD307|nr:Rieske 2Fe-2S domain-containing protein [Halopseudomonas nanhaiensis]UAW97952.1 Rieske 2Fe-2S domain-containing protein [Halopseudomonas nanhaiensis]